MAFWHRISRHRGSSRPAPPRARTTASSRFSPDFIAFAAFIVLVFVAGGGSRADSMALVLIRPVAILLAFWWAVRLTGEHLVGHRWLMTIGGAVTALVALYLVPLPPSLWKALPGHDLIADVDRVAALGDVWRPLSIAPEATRNALFSLTIPIATALGMLHLSRDERRLLLPLLIGIASVSLFLSLAQDAAPGATALWLHRVTNAGDPVGLFANRNHNAVFLACLPLLLAVWAFDAAPPKRAALRRAVAIGLVVLAAVAILVAGSRAGLIALGLSLAGSLLVMPMPKLAGRSMRLTRWAKPARLGLVAGLLLLAALATAIAVRSGNTDAGAGAGSGSEAIDRLGASSTDDFRIGFWQRSALLTPGYLPLGSGPGTFVEAYQQGQPEDSVGPNYVNHAHNDFLEVALTIGVPGVVLLMAILVFLVARAVSVWRTPPEKRRNVYLARAASLMIALLALASVVDYPVRVPSLAAFATILAVWLAQPRAVASDAGRSAMAFPNRLG